MIFFNIFHKPYTNLSLDDIWLSFHQIIWLPFLNNIFRSPAEFDISVDLYPEEYCKIITEFGKSVCSETSIIELWATDSFDDPETEATINSLTQEQIFDDINKKNFSEVYFEEKDFTTMLGNLSKCIAHSRLKVQFWEVALSVSKAKINIFQIEWRSL